MAHFPDRFLADWISRGYRYEFDHGFLRTIASALRSPCDPFMVLLAIPTLPRERERLEPLFGYFEAAGLTYAVAGLVDSFQRFIYLGDSAHSAVI